MHTCCNLPEVSQLYYIYNCNQQWTTDYERKNNNNNNHNWAERKNSYISTHYVVWVHTTKYISIWLKVYHIPSHWDHTEVAQHWSVLEFWQEWLNSWVSLCNTEGNSADDTLGWIIIWSIRELVNDQIIRVITGKIFKFSVLFLLMTCQW